MAKKLALVFLLLVIAPASFANNCKDCEEIICSTNDNIIAPQCTPFAAVDKGYRDCRDVANCGGCMGWTCVTRDPQDLTVIERPQLVAVTLEVHYTTPAEDTKRRPA